MASSWRIARLLTCTGEHVWGCLWEQKCSPTQCSTHEWPTSWPSGVRHLCEHQHCARTHIAWVVFGCHDGVTQPRRHLVAASCSRSFRAMFAWSCVAATWGLIAAQHSWWCRLAPKDHGCLLCTALVCTWSVVRTCAHVCASA